MDLIGGLWQAPAGGGSVDLDGFFQAGAISQVFSAPAGNYILNFDLSGNPGGGPTTKTLLVNVGSTFQIFTFTLGSNGQTGFDNMGYVPETLLFGWTGGSTSLTFTSLDDPENAFGPVIGAVSVSAVPEPATWAMMLLGFAGIGLVAYRRTKKHSPALAAA